MITTNEKIYELGNGKIAPYKKEVTKIPPIHY